MALPQKQNKLSKPSPLLDAQGNLAQVGWSPQPLLDCNLEQASFYRLRPFQRFRIKRWDYYGLTTPTHYLSFTLADLGYAGQVFAYIVDLAKGQYHEETLTIPLGKGIHLPRNSEAGSSRFDNGKVKMEFSIEPGCRKLSASWPGFGGKELAAEVSLALPPEHESMNIVIPIGVKRFYLNRKINCLPAQGWASIYGEKVALDPRTCLGNLDWGRGVWEYRSFWVWASASGFLPGGGTIGLNLGFGFGDTSHATENAVILDGQVHKLGRVDFTYDSTDYKRPWKMLSDDGRLQLEFTPSLERLAQTNLVIITSQVHQMFGAYRGTFRLENGEQVVIDGLPGFAEEHHAHW